MEINDEKKVQQKMVKRKRNIFLNENRAKTN